MQRIIKTALVSSHDFPITVDEILRANICMAKSKEILEKIKRMSENG